MFNCAELQMFFIYEDKMFAENQTDPAENQSGLFLLHCLLNMSFNTLLLLLSMIRHSVSVHVRN
jgi:hypothetical protein